MENIKETIDTYIHQVLQDYITIDCSTNPMDRIKVLVEVEFMPSVMKEEEIGEGYRVTYFDPYCKHCRFTLDEGVDFCIEHGLHLVGEVTIKISKNDEMIHYEIKDFVFEVC